VSIHPTAIVDPKAQLHASVEIGPYAVIGPQVKLGEGTTVGPHAVIVGDTTIGKRNRIFQFASVGAEPQDLKYAGEDTKLVLGDENLVREFSTLHKGTAGGGGVTRIGNKNLFMAYSHVAHDCQVGDSCVLANSVALAGHVEVGDHAVFGGLVGIHQFTRIGRHAFIAAGAVVVMDVAPYCVAQGDRAELAGLNKVGLQRHGYTDEQLARIKEAYQLLFQSKLKLDEAVKKIQDELGAHPEIALLLAFIGSSKRGLTR
jgi:UDP-N-acetylglucosamine acyltransferase